MNLEQKVNYIKAFNRTNNFDGTENFIEFDMVTDDLLEVRQMVGNTVRIYYFDRLNEEEIATIKHTYGEHPEVEHHNHTGDLLDVHRLHDESITKRIDIRLNEALLINAAIAQKMIAA